MTLRSISFGYKLELGRLIILEEEAQIVRSEERRVGKEC